MSQGNKIAENGLAYTLTGIENLLAFLQKVCETNKIKGTNLDLFKSESLDENINHTFYTIISR